MTAVLFIDLKKKIYLDKWPTIWNHLAQSQALETQRRIKGHFEQLHQVLYQEESARIAAVKKEEEEKIAGIKDMVKEQSAEEQSVTETISAIQEQLEEDEIVLLKVCHLNITPPPKKNLPIMTVFPVFPEF